MRPARTGRHSTKRVTVALVAAVCAIPIGGLAQARTGSTQQTAVERGRATFSDRCAACHGDHGKGNGPASSAMKSRPTNLTRLQRSSGGFPAAKVEAALRGTDPVVAHGAPGMMVWGAMFLADANGDQAVADARIRDVVGYVESIQVK